MTTGSAPRRQMRLLLDAIETEPELHPEDHARLRAVADAATDPADHGNRAVVPELAEAASQPPSPSPGSRP